MLVPGHAGVIGREKCNGRITVRPGPQFVKGLLGSPGDAAIDEGT
jgi:hypothetical protein